MNKLQEAVIAAAIAFVNEPEMREHREELRGTESMSAPVEFMNLCDAVEMLEAWTPQPANKVFGRF